MVAFRLGPHGGVQNRVQRRWIIPAQRRAQIDMVFMS